MDNNIQNPFLKDGQSIKSIRPGRFGKRMFTFTQKIIAVSVCLAILVSITALTAIKRNNKQTKSPATYTQPGYPAVRSSSKPNDQQAGITSKKSTNYDSQSNYDILDRHNQAMASFDATEKNKSSQLFNELYYSSSPVIAANAAYQLAIIQQENDDHIHICKLAHRALNLINFIDDETGQYDHFKNDCELLIAESLGNYALALKPIELDSNKLSLAPEKVDLLEGLSQPQAQQITLLGTKVMAQAAQKPLVEIVTNSNSSPIYNIVCNELPLDELLLKISSLNALDVVYDNLQGSEHLKKFPVTLSAKDVSLNEVIEKAAGAVGLLAKIERTSNSAAILIINPSQYQSLSSHAKMMNDVAANRWTSFLLNCDNDTYSAAAHVSLGLLQIQNERPLQAIAQFDIVSENFYQSLLAPLALLYSAKTKASIKDYNSAIDDLALMVEQYPTSSFFHQGFLELADIQFKSKNYKQAAKINEKIYTTETAQEIKEIAAYAAAQCYFQNSDNKNTHKWLSRYFDLVTDTNSLQYQKALIALATTCSNMKEYAQANQAFLLALETNLSQDDYATAAFGLTDSLLKTNDVSSALAVLENIDTWQLTPSQAITLLQTKSKIYHQIGLTEKAITVLKDKQDTITDPSLKSDVVLQLAQYLKETGQLEKASRLLTNTLTDSIDYTQTRTLSIVLADTCLAQGNHDQAISTCHKLLDFDLSVQDKKKTLNIMANAYKAKGLLDEAALALLGQAPQKDNNNLSLNN